MSSEIGEMYAAIKERAKEQRTSSLHASLAQIVDAQAAAREIDIDIIVGNGGHHWRFLKREMALLSFWPASARMQAHREGSRSAKASHSTRCRGWKQALATAREIAEHTAKKAAEAAFAQTKEGSNHGP